MQPCRYNRSEFKCAFIPRVTILLGCPRTACNAPSKTCSSDIRPVILLHIAVPWLAHPMGPPLFGSNMSDLRGDEHQEFATTLICPVTRGLNRLRHLTLYRQIFPTRPSPTELTSVARALVSRVSCAAGTSHWWIESWMRCTVDKDTVPPRASEGSTFF